MSDHERYARLGANWEVHSQYQPTNDYIMRARQIIPILYTTLTEASNSPVQALYVRQYWQPGIPVCGER